MITRFSELLKSHRAAALLAIVVAQLVLLALLISQSPAPLIETDFGSASVTLSADRAWTVLPGQCATLRWELEGIASVYVNGEGKVGRDDMEFCPTPSSMQVSFEIMAASGETRDFSFIVQSLPAAIQTWLLMLGLLAPALVAAYFLATMRLAQPSITDLSAFLLLAALLLSGLLLQTAQPHFIAGVLDQLAHIAKQRAWHELGFALAGVIYLPLAVQALRKGWQRGSSADFMAIGAFLLVLLLVFSTGIESIPQWEIWNNQSFLEGRPSIVEYELALRFWLLVPHALATAISPDTFAGYHVVNVFMFWGTLALFYAILRQLRAPAWLAFLATILFLFYPVNSGLMTIRSIAITFNRLSLLAAVYLILECRENPSRLRLLGVWLALLFNIGSYEIALVIFLVAPLLWWRDKGRRLWRNINLTAIWYLVPIIKVAHVLLLITGQRQFYGMRFISGSRASDQLTPDKLGDYLNRVAFVYHHSFVEGWLDALNAISRNAWAAPTLGTLAIAGLAAAYLARLPASDDRYPRPRQITAAATAGFLFILPAVGVLIWFDGYATNPWQIYTYVPIGAAIVVLGLLALAAAPVKNLRWRQALIVGLSLLLIWPGLSRLYLQQRQYRQEADAKAIILQQIVEQAPGFREGAHLMLFSTMTRDDLWAQGLSAFYFNPLYSAVYMLYQERRPLTASMCIYGRNCSTFDTILPYLGRDFLGPDETYSDVVMFQLHDDLRAELLRELPPALREREVNLYNPERLIDDSAPLPPRARSLLASAWRD